MSVFAISDTHLGHRNITKYRTEFKSSSEHDEYILTNLTEALTKRDVLFLLGDNAFSKKMLQEFKKFPFRIKACIGNHDLEFDYTVHDMAEVFDSVFGFIGYKETWLSHCPIHADEFRDKLLNIHGHTHYHILDDDRYINVCAENIGYTPLNLTEALAKCRYKGRFSRDIFND